MTARPLRPDLGTLDRAELLQRAVRSAHYPAVRRRIFRQLLESLLYENLLTARELPAEPERFVVDGRGEDGAAVRYVFRMRCRGGFDRRRIGPEPVRRQDGHGDTEAMSLTRFLLDTRDATGAAPDRITGFARELEETLLKDALAQHVRAERGERLHGASYDDLEGRVIDGHPYHPAYKSRLGFDLDDHLDFGPEFARPVRPLWLAVRRDYAHVSTVDGVDEAALRHAELGPAARVFAERIRQAGADPAEFCWLPVHPWQWRERIQHSHARLLRDGGLLVLGEDPDPHLAQQSIRTLACPDRPHRPYLKLALSMVNTSTSRVLATHTVRNAPRITDWLRRVVAADGYLRDELRPVLLGEIAGVAVDLPPESESTRSGTDGALACIWRESIAGHLDPAERAVPFTALTARELDGTPFVDPWVRAAGVGRWVSELLTVCLPPLLHLLQGHGIALEAHAQNLVLLHVDGTPSRLGLRDFHDGVRFSRAHLARPELCPQLLATPAHHGNRNSFVETERVETIPDFLLDACGFVNLDELAMFLADHYALPEQDFWAAARAVIERYHRRFPELADRFALFDVQRPRVEVEQLTTRRLLPDTEIRVHMVRNPVRSASAGSR